MKSYLNIFFSCVLCFSVFACSREEAATNVDSATDSVAQAEVPEQFDTSVPLAPGPTPEEIEQQRFTAEWRKLQSFQAAVRAQQPPQGTAAAGQGTNGIQFIRDDKVKETFDGVDPLAIDKAPVRVPITGDRSGPSVLKAQVLLDRANFSVGAIDGRWGKNSEIAVYWFQREKGLETTGEVDERTYYVLREAAGKVPAVVSYALTSEDTKGPFKPIPEDVYDKAKLDCLCYESLAEALAEKFHTTVDLLKTLNKGVEIASLKEGQTLNVPNIRPKVPDQNPADIAKVVVSVQGSYLHGVDANGNVLFHAPTTLGSKYDPSPNETTKVTGIAFNPEFHYQPKLFHEVPDTDPEAHLKPGPNSPVGVVWMALDKPHFGIHGTADPDSIGYASSHGCVRLTNWDAHDLSRRVTRGILVEFVDTRGTAATTEKKPAMGTSTSR